MSDASESAARALMETGRGLAQAGNIEAALAVFRQAHLLAPPGSSLQLALEHLIERASGGPRPGPTATPPTSQQRPPVTPTGLHVTMPTQGLDGPSPTQRMPPHSQIPTMGSGWSVAPRPTVPMAQPPYPQAGAWKPQMTAPSRSRLLLSLILVTLAVGIVLFAVARLFSAEMNRVADLLLVGGALVFQPIRNAVLATILGIVQVWRLRERLPGERRLHFVLYASLGGLVGGFVGGIFGEQSITPSSGPVAATIGATIGGIAGAISAALQSRHLPDFQRGARWLIFNVASWAVIWAIGYILGWLLGNTAGVAAASGFITIATGLALTGFLYLSPELEY